MSCDRIGQTGSVISQFAANDLPAAVLWDLDGTLVDTEPAWMEAEVRLANKHGVPWTAADALALVGTSLPNAGRIFQDLGVPGTIDEIVDELIGVVIDILGARIEWQPGARRLLAELHDAGVPQVLVTMSYREMADIIVKGAPDGCFVASVTGDEVANGKPHPEPYLKAAEMIDVDITRCVAVEDSPTGLASATAAGARVIGVQRQVPVPDAPGRSRLAGFDNMNVETFIAIANGAVVDELS